MDATHLVRRRLLQRFHEFFELNHVRHDLFQAIPPYFDLFVSFVREFNLLQPLHGYAFVAVQSREQTRPKRRGARDQIDQNTADAIVSSDGSAFLSQLCQFSFCSAGLLAHCTNVYHVEAELRRVSALASLEPICQWI